MTTNKNNPYASPEHTDIAHYDYWLAKRIFYTFSVVSIVILAALVLTYWQTFQSLPDFRYMSTWEQVKAFLTDWTP